jgi:Raf kinase inhibitor-like YbhB/YbcL family protein
MRLTSPAFQNNENIPPKFTCDGENASPPLEISEVPAEAKSLVLIVDDPDAPSGDFVHWTVWNISPEIKLIAENSFPENTFEGTTDFGKPGYGGPCPPSGTHRYFFKLYALDTLLSLDSSAKSEDVEKAMEGHILDQATLIGLYQRQ